MLPKSGPIRKLFAAVVVVEIGLAAWWLNSRDGAVVSGARGEARKNEAMARSRRGLGLAPQATAEGGGAGEASTVGPVVGGDG